MTVARTPTLDEILRQALDHRLADVHVSMPGKVVSYDPLTCSCSVQLLLKGASPNPDGTDSAVSLPVIQNVPVAFPSGGGCVLTFPLLPGDPVLLVFADRSLDAWKSSGGEVDPGLGSHSLADAFAIPGGRPLTAPLASAGTPGLVLGFDSGLQVKITAAAMILPNGLLPIARVTDAVQAGPFAGAVIGPGNPLVLG